MNVRRAFATATIAGIALLAFAGFGQAQAALSERQLDNLVAYTRLLSLVRFFHPSDAVAAADWNRVAVAGVSRVRDAADPAELASRLEEVFRPLAPTLRIRPQGERPETPPELRSPPEASHVVAWRHFGGDFGAERKVFSSERIDDRAPVGFGTLAQAVLAGPLKGKKVRLRAWVRAEMAGDGRVQLGLRVDRVGGQPGFFDNMADRPLRTTAWKLIEIEGDVAADAERILVMLVVTGGGRVWLDEVSLTPVDGKASPILLNTGFDEGATGAQPPGWLFPYEAIRAGYHLFLRRGEDCRAGGCAEVASDAIASPRFVQPDQVTEVDLGGGVTAWLPVSLYANAEGTLPRGPIPPPPGVDANADTPETRTAAVALAWGLLQNLHPELRRDDPAWTAGLRDALSAAAGSADREAFARVARVLLVPLHDSRASLFAPGTKSMPRSLPLTWEWIEGRLVITGIADGTKGVRVGDVVEALDGQPVESVIADLEARVSAATPEGRRWRALQEILWGQPDSKVSLRLQGGAEIRLGRDLEPGKQPAGTALPKLAEPRPGILYVDLSRMGDEDLEPLLPRLASARGLIFDLRGGTEVSTVLLSHLIDRTASSSKWQVPVVMTPGFREVEWLTTFWTIEPKAPRFKGKIAFLTDGRADGYSETLLGMIEAHRLGEVVGARSGGSNGSLNRSNLPGGWRLMWSGQRVLKHDDSPLHGVGVAPTFPAARTLRGVAAGRDEIVERAVAVVGG